MKPPAPNPVSGLSTANEASTAADRGVDRVAALAQHPGAGLGGQRMAGGDDAAAHGRGALAREELGDVDAELAGRSLEPRPRSAGELVLGAADRRLGGRVRRSSCRRRAAASKRVATTVTQIWSQSVLVDVGAEDDVGVGVGGLADHLGRLARPRPARGRRRR